MSSQWPLFCFQVYLWFAKQTGSDRSTP